MLHLAISGFYPAQIIDRPQYPTPHRVVASLVSSPSILEVCPGWSHEPKSDDENYNRLLHIVKRITICALSRRVLIWPRVVFEHQDASMAIHKDVRRETALEADESQERLV